MPLRYSPCDEIGRFELEVRDLPMTTTMIRKKHSGLTIVELMVVIAITGVVLGMAVPAFDSFIERGRTTAEFNRFLGDLTYARSEAVKRGQTVVVCATTDQTDCDGSDWDGGWLVRVGTGGDILRIGTSVKGDIEIVASGFSDNGVLSFGGDSKLEEGVPANIGRFVFCDGSGATGAKGLTFSPFGQHRQMRDTNDDDIVDYDNGGTQQNVSC